MSLMCRIFGHNYAITSALGNYAFCTKCGGTLTIKDPYTLVVAERRWIHGRLMEMNEFNVLEEVVQDDKKILTEDAKVENQRNKTGEEVVRSKDPHEQ